MSSNNLRIIYENLLDKANIAVSSTASANTSASNLKKNPKSLVWRSASSSTNSVRANIVLSGLSNIVGGIILPFCNLTSIATIRVRGYTGSVPTLSGTVDSPIINTTGTLVFDTGNVNACPYEVLGGWNWGATPLGVNAYSYGGGTYARVWLPTQTYCTSLVIEIIDTNPSKYLEISRIILGSYWSPRYNTQYGLSVSSIDSTTKERAESGDLIITKGTISQSMTFNLDWLVPPDRLEFTRILRGNGLSKPLFISLFPDNLEDYSKEQSHQIYGCLSQLASLSHSTFGMYSTSIEIEEI